MIEVFTESAGQIVRVNTNAKNLERELVSGTIAPTVIPGYKVTERKESGFNLIVDVESSQNNIRLDEGGRSLIISSKESGELPRYPLLYSLFFVFNRLYQENGLYHLHGSSVSRGGKSILLLGPEDYGKSRIALQMCFENGFKLNGDEKMVIDSKLGRVIEGGNLVQMSEEKIRHYFSRLSIHEKDKNIERDKSVFDAEELGIFKLPGDQVKMIVYGHVCPYVPRFVKLEEGYARRKFYECLSENIRGHGHVLMDLDSSFPSLDTDKLAMRRVEFTKKFISDSAVTAYSARDSLENISYKLSHVFENGKN